MCDLICDVIINSDVFEAAVWAGKLSVYNKIMIKNIKIKNMDIRKMVRPT